MDIPNSFTLSGKSLEPPGLEWQLAPASLRLLYWKKFGELAAKAKDAELAAGLDKNGNRMAEIANSTREARLNPNYSPMGVADPNAPPLTPVYDASRTRSLLRWKADASGVTFYWAYDSHTGDSWGVILDYHRKPFGSRPARDVFGLSTNGKNRVKTAAIRWWNQYLSTRLAANVRMTPRQAEPVQVNAGPYQPPKTKRAPVAPYSTGWQVNVGGKFVNVTPTVITPLYGVRVGGR